MQMNRLSFLAAGCLVVSVTCILLLAPEEGRLGNFSDDNSLEGPVVLSMRMRGHDLGKVAAGVPKVKGNTASPHAKNPVDVKPQEESAQDRGKDVKEKDVQVAQLFSLIIPQLSSSPDSSVAQVLYILASQLDYLRSANWLISRFPQLPGSTALQLCRPFSCNSPGVLQVVSYKLYSSSAPRGHSSSVPQLLSSLAAQQTLSKDQLREQKERNEIWKTEAAMKAQLNNVLKEKSGKLWKQTMGIVHKSDPNAKIISSLHIGKHSAAKHAQPKAAVQKAATASGNAKIKNELKADLNAKVSSRMGSNFKQIEGTEEKGLKKAQKESKVAETAAAHAGMSLHNMKKILKHQLDTSVKSVVARAKQLESFNSDMQLQKRLKAELDSKTKVKQKKLLALAAAKAHLSSTRKNLSGKVNRAAKVRMQLSSEMKEENAIRSQLNAEAKAQGKKMLRQDEGPKKINKNKPLTTHDLERQLRHHLDGSKAPVHHPSSHTQRTKEAAHSSLLKKALGSKSTHLESFLRDQLKTSDSATGKQMYKKSFANGMLKGVEHLVTEGDRGVKSQNNAIRKAEMRLFQQSMKGAEMRAKQQEVGQAENSNESRIMATEKNLMKSALKLSSSPLHPVHQVERSVSHGRSAGHVVHDMAHANARAQGTSFQANGGLGHQKALALARQTAEEIKAARQKMLKEAQHDEDEAVE